jgi:hypothetical protein
VILHGLGMFVADMFKSRRRLEAENLFLRHQLNIALRRAPPRPRLYGRMCRENPLWGAPRIHGELVMLGFDVAQSTVSKYMIDVGNGPRNPGRPFCVITLRQSLPSTCAWFQPSRLSACLPFS